MEQGEELRAVGIGTPYHRQRPRVGEGSSAEGQIVFQLPVWEPHHLHGVILKDWAPLVSEIGLVAMGGLLEKVVGTPIFAAPSDFNGTGACCLTRIFTSW